MKLFFCDLETTGTDYKKNGIIQIAGVIGSLTEEWKPQQLFNWKIKPFKTDVVEGKALEVNHTNILELSKYPEPQEVYKELIAILTNYVDKYDKNDKFYFIGYNSRFDEAFLREFFKKNNDEYFGSFFFFPPIDVMNLAMVALLKERQTLTNFKLGTIIEKFNIKPRGDLHDAMNDIYATIDLFFKLYNAHFSKTT